MQKRSTTAFRIALLLLVSAAAAAADERPLTLMLDGLELHGSLVHPAAAKALVILHPGSGPTDRDGNQPGMQSNLLRLLSDGLAASGLAVLRYDKRGIGASAIAVDESALRPSHYISDLAAWADWARDEGGYEIVILLGHSEGAMFAKAAGARTDVDAVISLAGPGRRMGLLLLEQTEGRRPGELDGQFRHILAELEAGRTVDEVPPLLAALFRPSVQPYLIEWLAIDPAALAEQLTVPLLVVSGSTDLQVARADFDALAIHAGQSAWIEGMNHVLREQGGPLGQQLASYRSPDLPLHQALMPELLAFLQKVINGG